MATETFWGIGVSDVRWEMMQLLNEYMEYLQCIEVLYDWRVVSLITSGEYGYGC